MQEVTIRDSCWDFNQLSRVIIHPRLRKQGSKQLHFRNEVRKGKGRSIYPTEAQSNTRRRNTLITTKRGELTQGYGRIQFNALVFYTTNHVAQWHCLPTHVYSTCVVATPSRSSSSPPQFVPSHLNAHARWSSRTTSFLESSKCRTHPLVSTHPLETSGCRPRSLIRCTNRKVCSFRISGTNQTKGCKRGQNPTTKRLPGQFGNKRV